MSILKKIFNNQEDAIKLVLWRFLHNLVKYYNEADPVTKANMKKSVDLYNITDINRFTKTLWDCSNFKNHQLYTRLIGIPYKLYKEKMF